VRLPRTIGVVEVDVVVEVEVEVEEGAEEELEEEVLDGARSTYPPATTIKIKTIPITAYVELDTPLRRFIEVSL